jgi:3-oxoacyl-[acyl-carrier protein] reductase
MRLDGRIALVKGASRGIGAAIARTLSAEGAHVLVNHYPSDGDAAAAAAVVAELVAAGGSASAFPADVSDPASCAALIDHVIAESGRIDILVNNAGITRDGLIVRISDDDWRAVIDTDLSSVFWCTRAASRPMMKQRSGAIVNIASVVGVMGNAGQANYSAAKAGVIGLTKTTARELAGRGVRCNAVAPGFIETDMTRALPEAAREAARSNIAMDRLGSPEDVAATVRFLVSDEAAYITGQVIAVDGGMTFA